MTAPDSYCPTCAAAPGYDCIERGKVVLPHKARTENAQSLQKAQDTIWAYHLIDEAMKHLDPLDIATGEGRR